MTSANLTLRFGGTRLRAAVHWPRSDASTLALILAGERAWVDALLDDCVVVAVLPPHRYADDLSALGWVAEHAEQLGASADRLVLAGGARAARLAVAARDGGWPQLHRQVLVHLRFTAEDPLPSGVEGVAAATVVHSGDTSDDGRRYTALLRQAGVGVTEVRG